MVVQSARAAAAELVGRIEPADALEAEHVAGTLEWLASGAPVCRTVPPDTPPRHLVSYFVPFDAGKRSVLLGDHVKAGLWLPPGGHVEEGEDPRDTVIREAREELAVEARFHPDFGGARPLFLTVTPTVGPRSHTDVSLWFVLDLRAGDEFTPDPREYHGVRWHGLDEDFTSGAYDPNMGRFARKAVSVLDGDRPALYEISVGRARGGRKSDVSAAAGLFAVVFGVVIVVVASRARSAPVCPALPLAAGSAVSGQVLTSAQIGNAKRIYEVGLALHLPPRAAVIAIATAMQESKLLNLPYGDADSLGLFQQRPSRGWGTPGQVMDPRYAATEFYAHLSRVPGWQSLPLTVAAQDVQRSRYPDAYAQWEPLATAAVATFSGDGTLCSG